MSDADAQQYDLSPEAVEIARRRAEQDRDLLARLLKEGRVRRDPALGRNVPGRHEFRADVEARAAGRVTVNLALKPKRRRR